MSMKLEWNSCPYIVVRPCLKLHFWNTLQTALGNRNSKVSWPSEGNNWEKKWVGIFYTTWISNYSLLRTSPPFVWSFMAVSVCLLPFIIIQSQPLSYLNFWNLSARCWWKRDLLLLLNLEKMGWASSGFGHLRYHHSALKASASSAGGPFLGLTDKCGKHGFYLFLKGFQEMVENFSFRLHRQKREPQLEMWESLSAGAVLLSAVQTYGCVRETSQAFVSLLFRSPPLLLRRQFILCQECSVPIISACCVWS